MANTISATFFTEVHYIKTELIRLQRKSKNFLYKYGKLFFASLINISKKIQNYIDTLLCLLSKISLKNA